MQSEFRREEHAHYHFGQLSRRRRRGIESLALENSCIMQMICAVGAAIAMIALTPVWVCADTPMIGLFGCIQIL